MRFLRRCTFLALLVTGDNQYVFVAEVFGRTVLVVCLVIADLGPPALTWLKTMPARMQV